MKTSTTLRAVHRATGLLGLAVVASALRLAWFAHGDPVISAESVLGALLGIALVLSWRRHRSDGFSLLIDAEQSLERLVSGEMVESAPPSREPTQDALLRAFLSRKILPAVPPSDWSNPLNPADSPCWHVSVGREKLLVTVTLKDHKPDLAYAWIMPPTGRKEQVGIDRCREVLGTLRGVQEWFEKPFKAAPRKPIARLFIAAPFDKTVKMPAPPPPLAERKPLSPWLVAVRARHLPEVLPLGWSVPVAEPDHDVWMFEADEFFVMIGYCLTQDRSIKLSVVLVLPEGDNPGGAASVLGKLRNVRDFVPTRTELSTTTMYLGEVIGGELPLQAPAKAGSAALN